MKRIFLVWISILCLGPAIPARGQSPAPNLPLLKPAVPLKTMALFSTAEYQQKTLNRVNYHRALAGLEAFTVSPILNAVSQAHADYLNLNNETGHEETTGKDGFTGQWPDDRCETQGYAYAGIGEVISFGNQAEDGVDALITAIYHRFILLSPGSTETGIGDAAHPTFGLVQNINPARPSGTDAAVDIITVYPSDNQTGVPLKFNSDEESPDPVYDQNTVGYPVSIQFSSDYTVSMTDFTISKDEVALSSTLLDPDGNDPNVENPSENCFSVIPLDKLNPETVYDVLFEGTVDGQAYTKQWSFTTGIDPPLTASETSVTIGVGWTAEIQISGGESPYGAGWDPGMVEVSWAALGKLTITGLQLGETSLTMQDSLDATVEISVTIAAVTSCDIDLAAGWNLIALCRRPSDMLVAVLLADVKDNAVSVWKWDSGSWAVYLPGENDDGASYAAGKGFGTLSSINTGQGFWINSSIPQTLSVSGVDLSGSLTMTAGWNLAGLKKDQSKTISNLISGNASSIASVWKWDSGSWAVYLPGEGDGGESYAAGKDFGWLSTVNSGEGFWVNATQDFTLP